MDVERDNSGAATPVKCATCEEPMQSPLICGGCHALQPTDRLNYFEVLGLPQCYDVDRAVIRSAYLNASRAVHPDRFVGASVDAAGVSVRLSSQVNRAYQVLLDPVLRAEYLLELAGGESAVTDKTVPAAVLARTLALREEIDEAQATGDAATLERCRREIQGDDAATLARIGEMAARLPGDAELRRELRHVLNTVKYCQRLLESIK